MKSGIKDVTLHEMLLIQEWGVGWDRPWHGRLDAEKLCKTLGRYIARKFKEKLQKCIVGSL